MCKRQFTLRTSMAVIAAVGLVLAWVRSQGSFGYALIVASHSVVAWGLCLATPIAIARVFGPAIRGRRGRFAALSLLAIVLPASLYLAWGQYQATHVLESGLELDRGFPYPDWVINALARWFDARNPVTPGMIKLHGQQHNVGFVLGMLKLVFTSLTGFLLGVLWNRPQDATKLALTAGPGFP
jgi:hypothetical protein